MPVRTGSAELNGARIAWREAGAGTPVLLLHAFPLSGRMWLPQLESLPESHRWIAPDLRGFGESDAPDQPLSMEILAGDLEALLDHLRLERAHVCGVSMGGYVAFAFWRHHPERLGRLVLCDTRAGADSPQARMARRLASERVREEGAAAIPDLMLERLLGRDTLRDQPRTVERVREMLEEVRPDSFIRAQSAMAGRPDSSPALDSMTMPVLVMVGEQDALIAESDARALADAFPNGRLSVIAGAGHLPNLEQPHAFDAALQDFLT